MQINDAVSTKTESDSRCEKLRVLDLFSGIGGFSLGLERTGGFKTVAFCEIEEFPRKVLAKHWPGVPCYHDIRTLTKDILDRDGIAVDAICGGFPCQDISIAGNQAGVKDGTRSGLWSEITRLVGELRPQILLVENVSNLLRGPGERPGGWFSRILSDLAQHGYDAEWKVIYGTDVGVPQRRERVWLVAYPARQDSVSVFHQIPVDVVGYRSWLDVEGSRNAHTYDENRGSCALSVLGNITWAAIPHRERSGNDERLSIGLDRYKALGNAVVPQIPELIGNAILQSMREQNAA